MKVLCYNHGLHHKNLHALKNYKTIHFDFFENLEQIRGFDLSKYDIIYSPSEPFHVSNFPNTKFIFGPHFSTFPNKKVQHIIGSNSIYIQPSQWALDVWRRFQISHQLRLEYMPFGVDTDKFNQLIDIGSRNKVFIYFKNRNPLELRYLEHLLLTQNIEYKVFDYKSRYNETEYLDYLHEAKYGIWLGCHESQGFALEEALSCNVPLFVWSVKSMKQEHGCNYEDIPATSIPYWDERCGEYVYDINNFVIRFKEFLSKLEQAQYRPREYVVENLSMAVCEQRFIDLCNRI